MKKVLFSDEEYEGVLNALNLLLQDAEQVSDADHKVLIYQILQYFDSIHREPLSRLFQALKDEPSIVAKINNDPTIAKMLSLYDLIQEPSDLTPVEEEPIAFIPEQDVTVLYQPKKKDWLELGEVTALENKKLYPKNYERVNFLISRVDAEVFAIQNQCDGSFLPIDKGRLEDYFLVCPWHGCKYDIRTGKSINQPEKKLEIFPVTIEEDGLLKVEIAY